MFFKVLFCLICLYIFRFFDKYQFFLYFTWAPVQHDFFSAGLSLFVKIIWSSNFPVYFSVHFLLPKYYIGQFFDIFYCPIFRYILLCNFSFEIILWSNFSVHFLVQFLHLWRTLVAFAPLLNECSYIDSLLLFWRRRIRRGRFWEGRRPGRKWPQDILTGL